MNTQTMSTCTKLFYIGAGIHFQPVYDFPQVKEFIFMDAQPYTEHPTRYFDRDIYRNKFMKEMISKAEVYGFTRLKEEVIDIRFFWTQLNWKQKIYYSIFSPPPYVNPTCLTFENKITNQIVKYYVSTPFPFQNETHLQKLLHDIQSCDGMILCGYFPKSKILNYLPKSITWIGYSTTCFELLEEYQDEDNIFVKMMNMKKEERNQFFHSYIYVKDKVNIFTNEFKNDFYELYDQYYDNYDEIERMENEYIMSQKPQSNTSLFTSLLDFVSHHCDE
jgi:hypothetical protein